MTPPPAARIEGIVARDAEVAMVFRRGPSRWTEGLLWNLATDEVMPGQWIGGRVYTRRCDLSPDGRLLVGAYTNYRKTGDEVGWTAVSRAPYFTALSLWFSGDAWNGGGLWEDSRTLSLNDAPNWRQAQAPPEGLETRSLDLRRGEDEPIFTMRLERAGWTREGELESVLTNPKWRERFERFAAIGSDPSRFTELLSFDLSAPLFPIYATVRPQILTKALARGRLVWESGCEGETWRIEDDAGAARREFAPPKFGRQWLDVDARGRIVFGHEGCLWAWAGFPDGEPTLVADLNDHRFAPVEAPEWARSL